MTTQPTLLEICDLRVEYPEVVAIDGVSLRVLAGEVCGLVGPNGAGKTTLLRATVGLVPRVRGSIRLAGHSLESAPASFKRAVGYMAEEFPVDDLLTVWEFLDQFGRAYEVPGRLARMENCLALTKLESKSKTLCKELSRGMRQRLLLAKTLLHDPQLLLLDEPASGLDPLARIELRELLLKLRGQGKAVLISSHILAEMSSFCDRVVIMEKGRLRLDAPLDQLATAPTLRLSMALIGNPGQALEILRKHPKVSRLQPSPRGAQFDWEGDEKAAHELLATLIREGVLVSEWCREGNQIERALQAMEPLDVS